MMTAQPDCKQKGEHDFTVMLTISDLEDVDFYLQCNACGVSTETFESKLFLLGEPVKN